MKKKMLKRGLLGLPIGIAIGHIITLIISAGFGDGGYYPVTPELIDAMGSALNAVILQTVLCGIMGAGFAAASVIWELDSWSLAKHAGIFAAIFVTVWLTQYFSWKRKIKKMNAMVRTKQKQE